MLYFMLLYIEYDILLNSFHSVLSAQFQNQYKFNNLCKLLLSKLTNFHYQPRQIYPSHLDFIHIIHFNYSIDLIDQIFQIIHELLCVFLYLINLIDLFQIKLNLQRQMISHLIFRQYEQRPGSLLQEDYLVKLQFKYDQRYQVQPLLGCVQIQPKSMVHWGPDYRELLRDNEVSLFHIIQSF